MDERMRRMVFGPEGGGDGEDPEEKYNMMWLSGIVWMQQSEDYIRDLMAIGARTKTNAQSTPTQMTQGDGTNTTGCTICFDCASNVYTV